MNRIPILLFSLFCFLNSTTVSATHIIGGEIGYTYVSGYTYEITLTMYGDCAGSSFPTLPNAVPHIEIFKNGNSFNYLDLSLTGPGVEVTPVCPSEVNNTTCTSVNNPIPGVMRFIFKGLAVLDGPATNWSFLFDGSFGGNAGAGRTNSITNIVSGSRMALEATLNNTVGPNNSSVFTTIPTPFFCINIPQEYNQGAADPDGDQLSFSLVPGISVDNTGAFGLVTYISPYTFNDPVATVPGSFNFNASSGQMSFTPNLVQTSLVVNKVTETRGGIVVGTCMREMNLVVLNNCANQPPTASIPTSTVGAFDASRTITLCNSNLNPQFVINASDPDNQDISVVVSGLPSNATSVVTGNGTPNPVITINWNIAQPTAPGTYNFYVSCQDNGCPLSSKQTFAYTVILVQPFDSISIMGTIESCVPGMDGAIQVNTNSTFGGLSYALNGGTYQSGNQFTGLSAGVYTIQVKDAQNCTVSSLVTVSTYPLPIINLLTESESCIPGHDGKITIIANSSNGIITGYSIDTTALQSANVFTNLSSGIYTITVKDVLGCKKSSVVTLNPPIRPSIDTVLATNIRCFGEGNGKLQALVTPAGLNCTYQLQPGSIFNTNGLFEQLQKGNYTIYVSTDKGCKDTATGSISEPPRLRFTSIDITEATCDRNDAKILVTTNYTSPLIYTLRPATYINTDGMFTNVTPGYYTLSVRDANFCSIDSVIYVGAQPNLFTSYVTHKDLQCNGWGTEGEAEVFASNGVEPYTYLWTTDPPSGDKKITGLYYGWYFVDVTDATGCETKDTVYIQPGSCCENVYLPNAFTPNGDGKNDEWKLISSTGLLIDEFAVYNRWGQQVWSTKDQRLAWDGKQNGQYVNDGTYFYILRYQCMSDQKNYVRKGDITVLK